MLRRIVAYLDSFSLTRDLRQARLAFHRAMISLRKLQSQTGEILPRSLRGLPLLPWHRLQETRAAVRGVREMRWVPGDRTRDRRRMAQKVN